MALYFWHNAVEKPLLVAGIHLGIASSTERVVAVMKILPTHLCHQRLSS